MKSREAFETTTTTSTTRKTEIIRRCGSCFTLLQMKRWLVCLTLSFLLVVLLPTHYNLFEIPGSVDEIQSYYVNLLQTRSDPAQLITSGELQISESDKGATGGLVGEQAREGRRSEVVEYPPVIHLVLSELSNKSSEENSKQKEYSEIVSVWKYIAPVLARSDYCFPEAKQAMEEAHNYWRQFFIEEEERRSAENSRRWLHRGHHFAADNNYNPCPYAVSSMNGSSLSSKDMSKGGQQMMMMNIPCGLAIDSSITIVAIAMPSGGGGATEQSGFAIELLGPPDDDVQGQDQTSIVLHFNVRMMMEQQKQVEEDRATHDDDDDDHHTHDNDYDDHHAVIVQNSWTKDHGWGDEERCPNSATTSRKVDDLEACSSQVGTKKIAIAHHTSSPKNPIITSTSTSTSETNRPLIANAESRSWFPFKQDLPFAATLWVGWEGFHMTVNGKHITSYEYRQNLQPSLVNAVRLKGNVKAVSILSTGLPTSAADISEAELEFLKAPPHDQLPRDRTVELFIGVFSTANNFDRRMAVRRSWMQYEAVRSGRVVVRFFVGQHSNKQVNNEIWREALTFGDIQLMPFVDYYNLITLKTIAICIFGTERIESKYIMKTDDDTFVRVDEVLRALNSTGRSSSILYGSIVFDGKPHRDPADKWYTSTEEWADDVYPPWALGPGYIISKDIAQFVAKSHYSTSLKLFKLEDVCMGIWIREFVKQRQIQVHYMNDENFNNLGCSEGYIIAHYQKPRTMGCLWRKLQEGLGPVCCDDGP